MKATKFCTSLLVIAIAFAPLSFAADKAGVLAQSELQAVVPQSFFYAGKTAPVQLRNAAAIRSASGKLFIAGLVDVSGYSNAIAEKYQGLLLVETPVKIGGTPLATGAYGFGSSADGKMIITDIGGNTVFTVPYQQDQQMKRPTPLKIVETEGKYHFSLGKRFVVIEFAESK